MHLVYHHPIGLHLPTVVDYVGLLLCQIECKALVLCILQLSLYYRNCFEFNVIITVESFTFGFKVHGLSRVAFTG